MCYCGAEVHSGLITHDLSGSIPERHAARMAELVDAYDLKSYPKGCWFDSSYEQVQFYSRVVKIFNKSRYARNRQLARVIFYFGLYINILIIYGVFYLIYGLSIYHNYYWPLIFICYFFVFYSFFIRFSKLKSMFTWVLNNKFYKFIKSGFLIDFFFKKIIYYIIFFLFIYYNIFFSEKYIIEYIFTNFSKKITIIWLYFEQITNQFAYNIISLSLIAFIIYLIVNGQFT